jgi:alcohol dehydrogenase
MKAFVVDRYGSEDGLRAGEMPDPNLREDDVMVQIHAADMNPLDARDGGFKLILPYRLPRLDVRNGSLPMKGTRHRGRRRLSA